MRKWMKMKMTTFPIKVHCQNQMEQLHHQAKRELEMPSLAGIQLGPIEDHQDDIAQNDQDLLMYLRDLNNNKILFYLKHIEELGQPEHI